MLLGWLAAIIFILFLALSLYCFGYAAKKTTPLFVLTLQVVFSVILLFPLVVLKEGLSPAQIFTLPTYQNWIWLFCTAFLGRVVGNYFAILNLKTAGEKINSLLSPAITAATIVFSYFLLKDKLTNYQWVGAIVTIASIFYFLLNSSSESYELKLSKVGAWSGIITILLYSLSVISAIKGAVGLDIYHALFIKLCISAVVLLPFLFFDIKPGIWKQGLKFYLVILTGVVSQNLIADYLWYYSSYKIGVSVFQIWIATLPLFVYAIDVYFLKKSKASWLFILCSLVALIGVFLIMTT